MGPGAGAVAVAYMGRQGAQPADPGSSYRVADAGMAAAELVGTGVAGRGLRPRLEIALGGRGIRSPPRLQTAS